jgi:HK97 family phage prohead protease
MPDRSRRAIPDDPRRIEYRGFDAATRAEDDPGLTGYAATWWVVDSFGTFMVPGAFAKSLSERAGKIPHLWQHDPRSPIGKHNELREDDAGLFIDVSLIDDGAEGSVAIKRLRGGVPLGLSFGFRTIRERAATEDDPMVFSANTPEWVRKDPTSAWAIEEVKYYEDSTVTFPANDTAEIASVRADVGAQTLAALIEDLRAGRLPAGDLALVDHLAAAWQSRPEGARASPPPARSKARRTEAALLLARYGHLLRNANA